MARKYALFVGNSEYEAESLVDLEAPLADVRDLANVFRNENIGDFDEVVELINSPETEIRQAVSGFFLNKKPDDLLLLYFSGHGVLDDRGHLYLAVKDTQPNLLHATAISADFIAEDMDQCRSKRQILILDCCHSGAFRRGIKGGDKALTASTFEGNGSGRIVLTASDRREFAMEGNQVLETAKTSLFTHFLLEGILTGKADRDGDSFISLDEWYDYAYEKVVSNLPTQTPRRWVYNQEGRLVIARNPHPEMAAPAELSDDIKSELRDSIPKVRLGAISKLGHILDSREERLKPLVRKELELLRQDDNEEVSKAADRLISHYESIVLDDKGVATTGRTRGGQTKTELSNQEEHPDFWAWTRANLGLHHWRRWVVITLLAVGVLFGVRGLLTSSGNSNGTDNSLADQAEVGGAGTLGLPPEENDQEVRQNPVLMTGKESEAKNQKPDESEESSPPMQEDIMETDDSPTNSQQSKQTDDDQNPLDQRETLDAISERKEGTNLLNTQNPQTTSGEVRTQNEPEQGEETPTPTMLPIDRLHSELDILQKDLEMAISTQQWSTVPIPLANYYEKMLENFYSMFSVVSVKSSVGELESDDNTATLPVTMTINYKQKGRDEIKTLPFPAHWVWQRNGDQFELSSVRTP